MNSPKVIADMFNKKCVNFATTVEDTTTTTQELKKCIEKTDNNDDKMFAFPTDMTDVFITVGNLKNTKAFGIDGVPAEVLQLFLPVIFL